MVASAILSLILLGAFKVLAEGLRYVRVNQLAIDAQRSGLAIMSRIGTGMQSTRSDLIEADPSGLVYASATRADGTVEFDLAEQEVLWQKWVCLYFDGDEITLRELAISPPSINPGTPPSPTSFSTIPVAKKLSEEASRFVVTQVSTTPSLWSVELVLGSLDNSELYGMELKSEVGPRN